MTSWVLELVYSFCEIAKDMQPKYIEAWLKGEVKDYDMDMVLIDEKQRRETTYKKLANEIRNSREVKE